jgi:hypothetical protein
MGKRCGARKTLMGKGEEKSPLRRPRSRSGIILKSCKFLKMRGISCTGEEFLALQEAVGYT